MLIDRMAVLASLVVLTATLQASARGESDGWEVVEGRDGITTWKRELPERSFPLVRGEVNVRAPLDAVRATIEDWRNHPKWMHRCAEVVQLARISASESVLYNRTASPWPVKDRDVVFRLKREVVSPDQEIVVSFQSEASEKKPAVDGVVRMPRLVGSYRLLRVGPRETKVVYEVDADVGGSLPKWFVKSLVADMPYQTLSGLRGRIDAAGK